MQRAVNFMNNLNIYFYNIPTELNGVNLAGSMDVRTRFHPSLRPSFRSNVREFVRSSIRPSIRPSVSSFIRPSVHPSVRPSVRPFVRSSVRPSVRMPRNVPGTNGGTHKRQIGVHMQVDKLTSRSNFHSNRQRTCLSFLRPKI